MSHEGVLEAAVVAIPHARWQERPLACVTLKEAYKEIVSEEDLKNFLKIQFATWWIPDSIVFMDEIPKTSVGKFLKRALREQLQDYFMDAE
jgi:fatty-acyl-CoA synthase